MAALIGKLWRETCCGPNSCARASATPRLVEALDAIGIAETEAAIKNKVSRGRFTFVFFLQAMAAIGVDWMQVPTVADLAQGRGIGDHGAQQLAKRAPTPNS